MPKGRNVNYKVGATSVLMSILTDGEWHDQSELAEALTPFVMNGTPLIAASELASQLRCERMGMHGHRDNKFRWRPDVYLEQEEKGHERGQFKAGAAAVLAALIGIRSFQAVAAHPGQLLNPTQRYWLDKMMQLANDRIKGVEADDGDDQRPAQGT
jgi:hypothetical protein